MRTDMDDRGRGMIVLAIVLGVAGFGAWVELEDAKKERKQRKERSR
jgi:hypothetical protein